MKKTSDKGYFITSPDHQNVSVEKAHFCTWRLPNGSEFLEVGMLIRLNESILAELREKRHNQDLKFEVFIPWYDRESSFGDLFQTLQKTENAKFVFNEQVCHQDHFYNGGSTIRGVLLSFANKEAPSFSLLPVDLAPSSNNPQTISAKVLFPSKKDELQKIGERIYFRFFVKPKSDSIPWDHGGIAKTTFYYDIKVNEPRNAPNNFPLNDVVKIKACYCLHIVPYTYECVLQDRVSFKSIRMLESFEAASYIKAMSEESGEIKPGGCLVVFNKAENGNDNNQPFSFFTVFAKESIGPMQLMFAIGANIFCNFLVKWTWKESLGLFAATLLLLGFISKWDWIFHHVVTLFKRK